MTDDLQDPHTVVRRPAQSGRVSYGNAVVLRESGRSRVVFIPFYIPRSHGTDLSIKMVTYRKAEPPNDWATVEEKSLSLDEAAARQLLAGIREHLRIADESEDGNYIVIKVTEGTAQLGEHDPKAVASALARVLSSHEIVRHLSKTELSTELLTALRGAIRLSEMRAAVTQLRQHLDGGEISEQKYQDWCQKHSWAFGNAYVMRDDVRDISASDRLDMLLPTVISGYRDIVELKRPDMAVLYFDESHRNYYFSADVSKAIGQCHRYLDILHEVAAQGLRDHPEIVAYHPRAIIVIGRSKDWPVETLRALHGLNCRLAGLTVMTYDQLLAQGERLIEMLSHQSDKVADGIDDIEELQELTKDDFPF